MFSKFKIEKYGLFWKTPYVIAFSILPFCMLHDEVWIFWIPYLSLFLICLLIKQTFHEKTVLFITLIGLPFAIIHHQTIAKIDLLFFGRLLLFIQLGFLLIPLNKSIVTITYFINFVLVLVAAALTFEFWFAIYLIIFFMLMGYVFLELQFLGFNQQPKFGEHFRYSLKLIVFIFFCGYLLFLITPRFRFGKLPSQIGLTLSGFSDKVSFNDVTNILQSDKVAMRVKTSHSPSYYRGITLDFYNGSEWQNTSYFRTIYKGSDDNNKLINLPIEYPRTSDKDLRSFEFQLMPGKNKYLFLPQYSQSIAISPPILKINHHNDLKRPQVLTKNQEYIVFTSHPKDIKIQDSPIIDTEIKNKYLQLPDLSVPVKTLAQLITKDKTSYWQKVQVILDSFENRNYKYSLKSVHEGDHLESFLLRNRVGHCQYFAGAMVVLLRLNGIPSRMVNGFSRGEYNEWGDYYTVRYRDAHSWVEVYAGNGIWITKDPTPANTETSYGIAALKEFYSQWMKIKEFLDAQWQDYILYYSNLDQQLIWLQLHQWFKANPILGIVLMLIGVIALIIFPRLYFTSFKSRSANKNKLAKKFDNLLHKIGAHRIPHLGFQECIQSLTMDARIKKDLLMMSVILNKITYGKFEKEINQSLIQQFNKLYSSILNRLKR